MKRNNSGTIYGIQVNDEFKYVGKTRKNISRNKNNPELKFSDAAYQYHNDELRNIIINGKDKTNSTQVKIVELDQADYDNWYNKKLKKVVEIHSDGHNLLNPDWMVNGGRGYWQNKKRDDNTINRLSESKFIRICQYTENGCFIKTWNSIKEAAITIFNDYKIINGSACSELYQILYRKPIKNRIAHNSYWFYEHELIKNFNVIPKKLNIDLIIENQKQKNKLNRKPNNIKLISQYSIIQLNSNGDVIHTYPNIFIASDKLKLNVTLIRNLCRGMKTHSYIHLKYGKKTKQPFIKRK